MNKKQRKNKTRIKSTIIRNPNNNHFVESNCICIPSNGKQPNGKALKFIDTLILQNMISTGTVTTIFNVTQGVSVNQRTGDTAIIRDMWVNFDINSINLDNFTNCRLIVFQWIPNSMLGTPVTTNILQTANILSFYNFQFSNQFIILFDFMYNACGNTTSPGGGNIGFGGHIVKIHSCRKKVEWNPGIVSGSCQFYILTISDSAVAPFPSIDINTRIMFDDNV